MDVHRAIRHRFFNKRQDSIGSVLGSIFGNTPTTVAQNPTTSQATGNTGVSEIIGGITSVVDSVSTVLPSSTGSTSPLASSARITSSSVSSTASASTRVSATSTTPTPTPSPTPTPTSTPFVSDTVVASSDGTRVVYITSTLPAASATASPAPSFLQNPSLEGGVFALVGVVALIILILIVTWTIRKRRRDRLERDIAAAVTFDPGATDHYERQEDEMEKRKLSVGSSSHGHGYGYGMQPAYMPQQEYHGPMGYGWYPAAAYTVPPSNPAPYQTPSHVVAQPQGGANLTRKFSDRKPVPPLIPAPAYDPSNTHVSIPPQFN